MKTGIYKVKVVRVIPGLKDNIWRGGDDKCDVMEVT